MSPRETGSSAFPFGRCRGLAQPRAGRWLFWLEHVAWPARDPTLTPAVARRILDVHGELVRLIEMRDGAGAGRLMDEHVKMIRARACQAGQERVWAGGAAARGIELGDWRDGNSRGRPQQRQRRRRHAEVHHRAAFRLQEWVAEEKGYFKAEGLDYEFRELVQATGGKVHDKGDKVGAYQSFEKGAPPT